MPIEGYQRVALAVAMDVGSRGVKHQSHLGKFGGSHLQQITVQLSGLYSSNKLQDNEQTQQKLRGVALSQTTLACP